MNNIIRITAYKDSGKWYSTHESVLKEEHSNLAGYELLDLIKNNDESVREYSCIQNGFPSYFFYVVDVMYMDKANQTNFCNYLVLAKEV